MTQQELYAEIKRIDGFIEVLQGFLKNPICSCISSAEYKDKKFTQENTKQLQSLINIRNFLLTLKGESNATLSHIHYDPVRFTCEKEELFLV